MYKESKAIRESFSPYPSTVLTPALEDYAATHLNETEEAKVKGLQAFNEILQKDFEVTFCEDIYILCFLRTKKYDVKKAAELFYSSVKFVDSHRKFFERPSSSEVVRRFLQANVIGFLPYRDSKSRAILYLSAEAWDPEQISADEAVFGAAVSIFSAIENPVNQVAGMIVMMDLKHLKLQQIIAFSSWIVLGTQALQSCCPFMMKEVHFINVPPVFKAVWKLMKPVISDKIRKRIIFHKSFEWKTLHNLISPKILPSELGGLLGPFSNEHWAKHLDLEHLHYKFLELYLPKKHISLSKK